MKLFRSSGMLFSNFDTCGRYGIPDSYPERPKTTEFTSSGENNPVHPKYRKFEERLQSFMDWPISIKQKPEELSEAGFFYEGEGDITYCFYCGGALRRWEENDQPWKEHAKWYPDCTFVRQQKGQDFISDTCRSEGPSTALRFSASEIKAKGTPQSNSSSDLQENEEPSSDTLCKICCGKEIGAALLPCGHALSCVDCALSFTICPVCREQISEICKIFLS